MSEAVDSATGRVRAWLAERLGGAVVRIARQPRWRPVWFADVERDGELLELCVRGERTDMPLIFSLEHEMRFQQVLYEQGIPVARVHGWIDDPVAYVMDRVPGRNDFSASSDEERRSVVDEYLVILARLHALDLAPFVEAGIVRAAAPEDSGQVGMARYEHVYRSTKRHPEPFTEFCLGWIRRHPARSRGREAPVVWDSGQLHHVDGHVTAILDLELGHVGDPMMDLAGWRMRDTIVGYGDFRELYERYAELRGTPVDLDAIRLHHVAFSLTNQLAFGAALREPPSESDLMTNLQWCCETNLFATEAIAEQLGVELPTVEVPESHPSSSAAAHAHLVRVLRSVAPDDVLLRYRIRGAFRLARHLQRVDEIGAAVVAADLDDAHALLGRRPGSWEEAEAELERYVLADADAGAHDEALLALFHRQNLRAQMLLGPAGSAMARHLPVQPFGA